MQLHPQAYASAAFILFGYLAGNSFVQFWWYRRQASTARRWRTQLTKHEHTGEAARAWWLPALGNKSGRPEHARLFTTVRVDAAAGAPRWCRDAKQHAGCQS